MLLDLVWEAGDTGISSFSEMSPSCTRMACALYFMDILLELESSIYKNPLGCWVWRIGWWGRVEAGRLVRWLGYQWEKRRGKRGGRKAGKGRALSATDGLVRLFRGSEGSGRGPGNTRTELWMPGSLSSQPVFSGDIVKETTQHFLRDCMPPSAVDESSSSSISWQHLIDMVEGS